MIRLAELIDQALRTLRLLHDALLVVLAYGARELVVVHGRPILAPAPQLGHAHRVLDLEDALAAVDPAYGRAVHLRRREQLLEELPQVNVRTAAVACAARALGRRRIGCACGCGCG